MNVFWENKSFCGQRQTIGICILIYTYLENPKDQPESNVKLCKIKQLCVNNFTHRMSLVEKLIMLLYREIWKRLVDLFNINFSLISYLSGYLMA